MSLSQPILLELSYFPPVQYFTKFLLADQIFLEAQENYRKGTYRNRCYIAGSNGPLRLSVPLAKGKNEQMHIREVGIAYHQPWPVQHWRSIRSAYGNSPFYDYYGPELEAVFTKKPKFLFDLNWELLEIVLGYLNLDKKISFTEHYTPPGIETVTDLRDTITPKEIIPDPYFEPAAYPQVFTEKHGFLPNLSILDLLFCMGPQAIIYLEQSVVDP